MSKKSSVELRVFARLLEAARGPSKQASADDPYGEFLFAKKRKDLKGTPAAKEKDTPEEAALYQALDNHYNNKDYDLGGHAEQILDLVSQGKYAKLLAPPPGPYYRIISNIDIPTLCGMLGIGADEVVYGKHVRAGGGTMKPGGALAGSSGIHSWSTKLDPSWVGEDLRAAGSFFDQVSYEPAAALVIRADGGKNFFANPEGMSNVGGLGPYVAKQDEVISYGPVRFTASAYFAARKQKTAFERYDVAKLISKV